MKKQLRLGVIGCGGFTSGKHLPNLKRSGRFALHALCDKNEDIRASLTAEYAPVYATTDFHRVVEDPAIDAVLIGTKPDFRLPIMQAAIQNGKHLFVEKPISMNREETLAMYRLVKDAPVKFMVGHNRPYSPIMRDAKDLFVQARDTVKQEHNNTLLTYRIIGEAWLWPEHHRSSVYRGESTVIHELTHIFDLFNWMIGGEPTSLFACGCGSMDNIISLTYPGQVRAVIISGDNGSLGYPKECLEIDTNHCVISARSFVELAWAGTKISHGRKLYPYQYKGKEQRSNIMEYEDLLWRFRDSVTEEERSYGYYYKKAPAEDKGHYEQLNAFYDHITENAPIVADARAGALATLIALEAICSLEKRVPRDLTQLLPE